MIKSRFVDAFSKSCLIIKFILYKDNGYSSDDIEILQFIFSELPDKFKESINKLPQKNPMALGNSLIKARRVTTIQNCNIAIGQLYISFEIRELCMLLAFCNVMKSHDQLRNRSNLIKIIFIIIYPKVDLLLITPHLTYLIFLVNLSNQYFKSIYGINLLNWWH